MRPKSLALLLLALGCGLVASIGITEVMAKRNAEAPTPLGDTRSIFVAITDIGLGDLLTSQVLKLEQWPKDKVPPGAISRIEDIEGRRARTKLYAGEPILENRLLGKGASEQGATALIPKGYRVVPVQVDAVSGGSSLILPGDRVDVMVHLVRDASRDISETVTRTILQDIKVFAVDSVVDLEKEKESNRTINAKTISLLVTPEQAAKVMLARELGRINLVMRSSEDDQQIPNAQARPAELFSGTAKSERKKESLMTEPDAKPADKSQTLVEFLNTTKKEPPPAAVENKPRGTWSMRVLKAGEVAEVQFETADPSGGDAGSSAGIWKPTTPAKSDLPTATPPAVTDSNNKQTAAPTPPKQSPAPNKKTN
jgi:pilus assembly protein CpaB